MQQLQNTSEMRRCAKAVLETVLEVLVAIREKTARRHKGPSLVHMRAMGVLHKRPGANLSMLAGQLALTLSATSRLVDCLVNQGLVQRSIPAGNRRTVSLKLAPAGRRALQGLMRETQVELAQSLQSLKPRQRRELCRSLDLLHAVIEAPSPTARRAAPSR